MATEYSKELISDLLTGRLPSEKVREIQKYTDEGRFEKVLEIEQERLGWAEKILLCLQEHLYVVEKGNRVRVVRCSCGHEFGDYHINWKLNALVYERNPQDGEVYKGPKAADPNYMILREFYCPGCGTQLEVEAVPPGNPFVFNFLPYLD